METLVRVGDLLFVCGCVVLTSVCLTYVVTFLLDLYRGQSPPHP